MRLFAASFMSERAAIVALDALTTRALADDDVRIAPLGRASDPSGPSTVLAGTFLDDAIASVRVVVEGYGGTIIVDSVEPPHA